MTTAPHILLIPKWYPYREDPQLGIFIRKHAVAISGFARVSVIYPVADEQMASGKMLLKKNSEKKLNEYLIYYKPARHRFRRLWNLILYLRAFHLGYRSMVAESGKPDIIHAYILLRTAIIAWYLSKMQGSPYIVSEQWSGYASGKFKAGSVIRQKLCRTLFKHAHARTVVSSYLEGKMRTLGFEGEIYVIPNSIEIQTNIAPNVIHHTALVVADLVDEIKNVSGTIRAFAKVAKDHPEFKLEIIGTGKDRKNLETLAEQLGILNRQIFFRGLKSNTEVYTTLHQCDFVIMNSRFETFSLICAEAISCGKPVIASRCGGPESFLNEHTGILIPVEDEDALREAIEFMIQHPEKFDPVALKSYAEEMFFVENIRGKYRQVFASVFTF